VTVFTPTAQLETRSPSSTTTVMVSAIILRSVLPQIETYPAYRRMMSRLHSTTVVGDEPGATSTHPATNRM